MRGCLLLRLDRLAQRQNLRDDRLHLSCVDQARDLGEVFGIGMNGDGRSTNFAFPELDRVGARHQRHDNAALFYHAVRACERLFAHRIEHGVHIFGNLFEPRLCVIDRHVGAELLQEILVCRRGGRDDARSTRFGNLHCETTDAARATVNENGLPRAELRHIDQRLPRSQGAHRHRRGVGKTQRRGLRSYFAFGDGDVIRPAAAKSWVAINRVARFELCDFCSCFLNDPGDVVARN